MLQQLEAVDPALATASTLVAVEGVVKWFDPRKGFGFIVGPAGQDIFVHYSVIEGDGFRVLKDGSPVLYDAHRSDKGWKATRAISREATELAPPPRRNGYSRTSRR
jgi:CspA family cold shock protein